MSASLSIPQLLHSLKPLEVIRVKWNDILQEDAWVDVATIMNNIPHTEHINVGMFLRFEDDFLVLCSSVGVLEKNRQSDYTIMPVGVITEVEVL